MKVLIRSLIIYFFVTGAIGTGLMFLLNVDASEAQPLLILGVEILNYNITFFSYGFIFLVAGAGGGAGISIQVVISFLKKEDMNSNASVSMMNGMVIAALSNLLGLFLLYKFFQSLIY
tara:strand:- start:46 stop:399 length:354 start_codon:yes stop_codon:yes gene_type:complete